MYDTESLLKLVVEGGREKGLGKEGKKKVDNLIGRVCWTLVGPGWHRTGLSSKNF